MNDFQKLDIYNRTKVKTFHCLLLSFEGLFYNTPSKSLLASDGSALMFELPINLPKMGCIRLI